MQTRPASGYTCDRKSGDELSSGLRPRRATRGVKHLRSGLKREVYSRRYLSSFADKRRQRIRELLSVALTSPAVPYPQCIPPASLEASSHAPSPSCPRSPQACPLPYRPGPALARIPPLATSRLTLYLAQYTTSATTTPTLSRPLSASARRPQPRRPSLLSQHATAA